MLRKRPLVLVGLVLLAGPNGRSRLAPDLYRSDPGARPSIKAPRPEEARMGPTLAHPALDNARRQRVELLDVMHRLEHALAAPSGAEEWRATVGQQLGRLRG